MDTALSQERLAKFSSPTIRRSHHFAIILFFTLLFIIYSASGSLGYGNDNDIYLMLRSGQDILLGGIYHYSRPPGYFIPELFLGGASLLGGHFLTNLISSLLGIASLYLFWRLLKNTFTDTNAILIVAIVGLNPYFIIAASSSMDYVYSLFFGLLGVTALHENKYFLAALPFALALSSRLSNALIIGLVYSYFISLASHRLLRRHAGTHDWHLLCGGVKRVNPENPHKKVLAPGRPACSLQAHEKKQTQGA